MNLSNLTPAQLAGLDRTMKRDPNLRANVIMHGCDPRRDPITLAPYEGKEILYIPAPISPHGSRSIRATKRAISRKSK